MIFWLPTAHLALSMVKICKTIDAMVLNHHFCITWSYELAHSNIRSFVSDTVKCFRMHRCYFLPVLTLLRNFEITLPAAVSRTYIVSGSYNWLRAAAKLTCIHIKWPLPRISTYGRRTIRRSETILSTESCILHAACVIGCKPQEYIPVSSLPSDTAPFVFFRRALHTWCSRLVNNPSRGFAVFLLV